MSQYLKISDCPEGIQDLLKECLSTDSHKRPTFSSIFVSLDDIKQSLNSNDCWKVLDSLITEKEDLLDLGYEYLDGQILRGYLEV